MPKKHTHPLDKLNHSESITLSTLAANTGIIGSARVLTQDYRAMSIVGCAGLDNAIATNGPILYGLAVGNLSLVQIEEFLEDRANRSSSVPGNEFINRSVQILGSLGLSRETEWHQNTRIRLPTFQEDIGFNLWVYNISVALNSGTIAKFFFEFFGRWLN